MFYRNVRPLVNTTFHNAAGDYEFVTEGIINVGFQTESEYISDIGNEYLEVGVTDIDAETTVLMRYI